MILETLIIGAGFSGVITALDLAKRNRNNFLLIDRNERVGGTWEVNRYPGAEVDVPSLSYLPLERSKQFIPTSKFSSSAEIQRFIQTLVDENELNDKILLNHCLISATWDENNGLWVSTVTQRAKEHLKVVTFQSRFIIFGVGPLSIPNYPKFASTRFLEKGISLHTANWPKELKIDFFQNKTVAIVGTGSSAVQMIPEIAKVAKRLLIFQRTPSYCAEKPPESEYVSPTELEDEHHRNSFIEFNRSQFVKYSDFMLKTFNTEDYNLKTQQMLRNIIETKVKDPKIAKLLTPNYPYGCKRTAFSAPGYYETYNLPHVQLIPEEVAMETENGLKTASGIEYEVDCIIYATGFLSPFSFFNQQVELIGTDRVPLRDTSQENYQSLYGVAIGTNYPNAFMLLGPQGFLVHIASVELIEVQTAFVTQLIDYCASNNIRSCRPKKVACEEYSKLIKNFADQSIFHSCSSWYNENGQSFYGFAGKLSSYIELLQKDKFSKFVLLKNTDGKEVQEDTSIEFSLPKYKLPPYPSITLTYKEVIASSSSKL